MSIDLNLDNVPAKHFHTVAALITKAFGTPGDLEIINAGVGYVYERKGNLATDELGKPRNTSYASIRDDIVIQVAVRIGRMDAEKIGVFKLEKQMLHDQLDHLVQERAQAQAALDAADTRLTDTRKRLGL